MPTGCCDNRPGVYIAVAAYANWIEATIAQIEVTENGLVQQAPVYSEGATPGGCQCELDWRLTSGEGCTSTTIYRRCGMNPPCDGDTGDPPVAGQTWCVISDESRATAACKADSAGDQWDYCVPDTVATERCSSLNGGKCLLNRGYRPVAGDYLEDPTETFHLFH